MLQRVMLSTVQNCWRSEVQRGALAFYIVNGEAVLSPKCHSLCVSHRESEQDTTMLPLPTLPPQSASIAI